MRFWSASQMDYTSFGVIAGEGAAFSSEMRTRGLTLNIFDSFLACSIQIGAAQIVGDRHGFCSSQFSPIA
jgi:hypothetical protein